MRLEDRLTPAELAELAQCRRIDRQNAIHSERPSRLGHRDGGSGRCEAPGHYTPSDSSEVEHGAHNALVVGSNPTRTTNPHLAQLDRAGGFYLHGCRFVSCGEGQSQNKPDATLGGSASRLGEDVRHTVLPAYSPVRTGYLPDCLHASCGMRTATPLGFPSLTTKGFFNQRGAA